MCTRSLVRGWLLAIALLGASPALAQHSGAVRFPDRPADPDFVVDKASLVSDSQEAEINTICRKLTQDRATPIFVVTISSLSDCNAAGSSIEQYATMLFDDWGIGHVRPPGVEAGAFDWNRGLLLLVSKGDRKARIELGSGWGRRLDGQSMQIMDGTIIPRFRQGNFGQGIVDGVRAMEAMVRRQPIPGAPKPAPQASPTVENPASQKPAAPAIEVEAPSTPPSPPSVPSAPITYDPPVTFHRSSPSIDPLGTGAVCATGGAVGTCAFVPIIVFIVFFVTIIKAITRAAGGTNWGSFSGSGYHSRGGGFFTYSNSPSHRSLLGSSHRSLGSSSGGFHSSFSSSSRHSSLGGGHSGGGGATGSW